MVLVAESLGVEARRGETDACCTGPWRLCEAAGGPQEASRDHGMMMMAGEGVEGGGGRGGGGVK